MRIDSFTFLIKKEGIEIEEFQNSSLVLNVFTRETKKISRIDSDILNSFKVMSNVSKIYKELKKTKKVLRSYSLNEFIEICKRLCEEDMLIQKEEFESINKKKGVKVIQNPKVVLIEENKENAIIYNPINKNTFLLNISSLKIWNICSSEITEHEIVLRINTIFNNIPESGINSDVSELIEVLIEKGFIYKVGTKIKDE